MFHPPTPQERAIASLARLDSDFCPDLSGSRRAEAEPLARVRLVDVPPGPLDCDGVLSDGESGFGLLVIEGLFCRHVGRLSRSAAELVGPGDVFRPSELPGGWASIPLPCRWTVLSVSQVAILDRGFAERVAAFPEIAMEIHRRGLRRAGHLATLMGHTHYRRVETRLLLLFWHLADRFGTVGRQTIRIPLPLTHAVIAEMVGLRRPTVTTGLAVLESEDLLRRGEGCWLLGRHSAARLLPDEDRPSGAGAVPSLPQVSV